LKYNGTTNWLSFRRKFESYRKVLQWSSTECKDYLTWCLEGKALDFFTIVTSMGEQLSYAQIMKKMDTRFGAKELKETSKAKFRQAFQKSDESLEEWADRVMTLATPAFIDLPEEHMRQEAIARFCQGCSDKEAAKHACFVNPKSMEEALNLVKHHQFISQAVDGKKSKKKEEVSVNAVASLEDKIEQMIASALAKMNLQANSPQAKPQQKEGGKKEKSNFQCFFCKRVGHAKKDCEHYKSWLAKKQSAEDLNDKGLDGKTTRPSPKH
jgi:hypothetical protein